MMEELITYIARSLVDDPTQVNVTSQARGSKVQVNLEVAPDDMGRVIGRNGRVANAMRTLLRVSAAQVGKKASLDIVEPR
jgi:predicted RNA-binding protein YlqC (UPF0109 family)